MLILVIWTLVVVFAGWWYTKQVYSRFSKHGVKHLTPVPVLGNTTPAIFRTEHITEYFTRIYNSFPGERFVGNYEFLSPIVIIRDLELIKKVTVKDFEYFLDHKMAFDNKADKLFGRNLLSLKGQTWKDMRATLSPAFTSSKIRLMVPFMIEIGEQMIDSLKKKIEASDHEFIDIDSKDLLTRYTNDVIASCAFGLKVDSHTEEDNEFYKMGYRASNFTFFQFLKMFGYISAPNIMSALKVNIFPKPVRDFFSQLVLSTMQDRETRKVHRNDMIQLLMDAKKGRLSHDDKKSKDTDVGFATVEESDIGKKENNTVWNDDDLIAQAILFFIAGFDTVSTALVFLMYEMAINPEIQEKLVGEIREHHEKNYGQISYQSIQQMTYMDMVVSELLRLWSPAIATDRLCVKDYNLGRPNKDATQDFIIRKGESISIAVWALHRSPEYFPDPLKFDPERFSEENKRNIKPFTYLPFGLGPRNCIGSRFALCEVKVLLYLLLLQMELCPAEKTAIPVRLLKDTFNIRMVGGHWIRLKNRT